MQAICHNSAADDSLPNQWINWCRLCAKEDTQHNINFLYRNDDNLDNEYKKLGIQDAIKKYFCVQTSIEDFLPKMLCTNCLSLVSSMINFNERVERVQQMFIYLAESQKSAASVDLSSVRQKFDVRESERSHWFYNFTLTEIGRKCNELTILKKNQSAHDSKFQYQIKQEITEKPMQKDPDIDIDQCTELDQEEFIFTDNVNDSFPEDAEDPFQHEERGEKSSSETGDHEKSLLWISNKVEIERKSKAARVKTKRKRKRFKQFNNNDGKKKNISIKDFKIESSCKYCGKSFLKYMLYREHMQKQHNDCKSEKHWPCPACDKVLLSICNLERHVRIHMPIEVRQTIKCTECDNRYTSNAQLETHIRYKHKNEKPFICEECGLCLRTNSNLRQHMLTHTDVAPFECDVCKKKFKNKTRLKTHMDIHSPNKHVCNICGLQLNSRATLNRHFLVHSDEMQHKCDYCGKAFKRAKALKNHLLLHTGLKPYSCDFCERTFANGSNCRSHMKKMHPEELALLEASGNKTHTKNIPKLETLKAVTKAADNLTPVVTKYSGCFAFGKKPKHDDSSSIKRPRKFLQKFKESTFSQNDVEQFSTVSPSSTPLDLQYMPLVGNATSSTSLSNANNIETDLSSSTLAITPIPNFDNIYQHLLKHNSQTDLQIKEPLSQISHEGSASNVSTPQHNTFYHDIINHSIKTSMQHSDIPALTQDDNSNQSSIHGKFYGSLRAPLPPGNFM